MFLVPDSQTSETIGESPEIPFRPGVEAPPIQTRHQRHPVNHAAKNVVRPEEIIESTPVFLIKVGLRFFWAFVLACDVLGLMVFLFLAIRCGVLGAVLLLGVVFPLFIIVHVVAAIIDRTIRP